jgi:uncharacterized protein with FMN-binding domain
MSPRAAANRVGLTLVSAALAAMLLLGFKTPEDAVIVDSGTTAVVPGNGTNAPGRPSPTGAGPSATSETPAAPTVPPEQVVDGPVVTTRFGLVQVEVTVSGHSIITVAALKLPTHGRSGWISQQVDPMLTDEVMTAQSASIDLISGATYTSDAYARSLQAALDQAGF